MSSFLERYERGEYEQVWEELLALGAAVREEPLYADALAVARETMRRARHNIEVLIPRLVRVGYQFGYGWVQPFVRERLLHPYRANYNPATGAYAHGVVVEPSLSGRFTPERRLAFEEQQEQAQEQPPLFLPATDREERIARLEQMIAQVPDAGASPAPLVAHWRSLQAELREQPDAHELVSELEAVVGTLPLSIRAWYEVVGGINFVGDHPGWRALLPESATDYPMNADDYLNSMHVLDPLFVFPLDEARIAHYRKWAKPQPAGNSLTLAEDQYGKYLDGTKYYYAVRVPTAAVDAVFSHYGQTFTSYLRDCFRWGGFPGWAKLEQRPEQDLASLTRELLPL
jgi:hypothetical protein